MTHLQEAAGAPGLCWVGVLTEGTVSVGQLREGTPRGGKEVCEVVGHERLDVAHGPRQLFTATHLGSDGQLGTQEPPHRPQPLLEHKRM